MARYTHHEPTLIGTISFPNGRKFATRNLQPHRTHQKTGNPSYSRVTSSPRGLPKATGGAHRRSAPDTAVIRQIAASAGSGRGARRRSRGALDRRVRAITGSWP